MHCELILDKNDRLAIFIPVESTFLSWPYNAPLTPHC